uniref:B30.2/SPRY domain-containing protein n=1 Tax=Oryzias melastigma TaxID=30732 RepID=A0A3B3CHA6_ORYME
MQRKVKVEVSKAKQRAYDDLYARLGSKEGETDLYRLARQRDRDGKDMQQVRVIKDRNGNVRRADFLKYSCQITLDPNTAHTHLCVTEENRMVTVMSQQQSFFNNPDRFTGLLQVLSRESLTGRCYWEVEWRAEGIVMAVTYRNIGRAGNGEACRFGWNDKSWALYYHQNSYRFCHNSMSASISAPVSSRVGVYLDHRAGVLSFYSVSESMTLLHRVQTTFTQPLHAGLWLYKTSDTARLCKLK